MAHRSTALSVWSRAGGKAEESWFIDCRTFYGSPANPEVWSQLDAFLSQTWKHENGLALKVITACVDSGGHFTQNVYDFVRPKECKRIYAIKGMAGTGRPIIGPPSRNNKLRIHLFTVGVDTAKELVFPRLQVDTAGPGYMHFSHRCDEEYFKQLTAEKQVTKFSKGFPTKVWVKVRPRNEALDCEVYALAAYVLLNPDMESLALGMERQVKALKEPATRRAVKPVRPYSRTSRNI